VRVQVVDQPRKHGDVVADVAQGLVAVEAEDAADLACRVVVVDVLGITATPRADATLRGDHQFDVR
jgi:hypothetical protein